MLILSLQICLSLLSGTAFGLAFKRLKVPAGLLVGALFGSALLNLAFDAAYMPRNTKFAVQILTGAFIGCALEKSDILRLPHILRPTLIMLASFLLLNLSAGTLIYMASPLDLVTSLMSAVPGGIADTPIIADDMGADTPKVVIMQMVRQILGIAILPALIAAYDARFENDDRASGYAPNMEKRKKSGTKSNAALICTLIVSTMAGGIGRISGIPGATFAVAILGAAVLKLGFDFAYFPRWIKNLAQILSGCYFGSSIVISDLAEMIDLATPVLIIIAFYVANCFLTGRIIRKTSGFTRKESMLVTTPAGASDMALISEDMGIRNTDVIIMQVIRAVVVMSFFPQIVNLVVILASK